MEVQERRETLELKVHGVHHHLGDRRETEVPKEHQVLLGLQEQMVYQEETVELKVHQVTQEKMACLELQERKELLGLKDLRENEETEVTWEVQEREDILDPEGTQVLQGPQDYLVPMEIQEMWDSQETKEIQVHLVKEERMECQDREGWMVCLEHQG